MKDTKQIFNFKDSICIAQPTSKDAIDNAVAMLSKDKNTVLRTEIDATMSGLIINQRVYPGKKVQAGYLSFISKERGGTSDFDKPVLKHHDEQSDPIGRVVAARFNPLKFGDEFDMDFMNPAVQGKGSGVVTVTALISDPDSIRKIIDGRFISVSAGHSTDAALCSICGDSVITCNHMPGKHYDGEGEATKDEGRLCYVITNNMKYNELSFVNRPAAPPAKLINFNWADCKDYQDKNDILVESIVTGSKELVRAFSLVDSDDEINLLTGKRKSESKKTSVAVKPAVADKLKAALSLPDTTDDDTNIRQENTGSTVEQPEQNLKANEKLTNEVNDMDANELQKQIDSLKDQLSKATAKVTECETTVKAKDCEIQRLTGETKDLDSRMRKTLATSLAGLKIRLKKPDAIGMDSKDKINEYVTKLSTRALASLEDGISDLLIELEHAKETETIKTESKTTATQVVADAEKVEDPTLNRGGAPKAAAKSKESKSKDAKSMLDSELGL